MTSGTRTSTSSSKTPGRSRPSFLLSLGARYDVQLVPQPDRPNTTSPVAALYTTTINNYKGMVQPRIGFSWNPYEGTVVRGGYGIFYGLNSNSTYYTMRRENGVYQQQFNVNALVNPNGTYAQAGATCTPTAGSNRCFQQSGTYAANAPAGRHPRRSRLPDRRPINQVTGAPTPAVNTGLSALEPSAARGLDPNFQNPRSHSGDLTVEQQLPLHTALTIGYVGNRGLRLPIFVDTNVDPASAVTNTPYYFCVRRRHAPQAINLPIYKARLYNNTGAVLTGFSDVNSWYHSLAVTVRKPMSHGVEVLANYTWAKTMDGGQVSGVNGTFNGTDTPIDPVRSRTRVRAAAPSTLAPIST